MLAKCSYYIQSGKNTDKSTVSYYDCDGNLLLCEDVPMMDVPLFDDQISVPDTETIKKRIDIRSIKPRPKRIEIGYHEKLGQCVTFFDRNGHIISYHVYKFPLSNSQNNIILKDHHYDNIIDNYKDNIDTQWLIDNSDLVEFEIIPNDNTECVIC